MKLISSKQCEEWKRVIIHDGGLRRDFILYHDGEILENVSLITEGRPKAISRVRSFKLENVLAMIEALELGHHVEEVQATRKPSRL